MKLNYGYRLVIILFISFLLFSDTEAVNYTNSAHSQEEFDHSLLQEAFHSINGQIEFLVYMEEQADLSETFQMNSKEEKGEFVFRTLTDNAERSQESIRAVLDAWEVEYHPYWIANMIWVRGNMNILQALEARDDVARIYFNQPVAITEPEPVLTPLHAQTSAGVEWNITQIRADVLWEFGYTGQAVVIGGQDTGYEWHHPALIEKYRGWNGSEAQHDYHWHDAIREPDRQAPPNNPCGYASAEPCDDYWHGTHTMGTMVGDDGSGKQIGAAPDARWIGCRNMDQGHGKPSTYIECFEWFVAPYPYGGDSFWGNPKKAPHIINNSWGCPPSEGCDLPDIMETVVDNVKAAGILIVSSAGNSGHKGCETISTPTAIYENVFTVGATDKRDALTSFSSRGPVVVDGSGRLKPNVTAPGQDISSSVLNGSYGIFSGTSMAAPHVSGLAALLISAKPELAGMVDEIEDIIEQSSLPRSFPGACGIYPGSQIPNPFYGWGRVDAISALALVEDWPRYYFPLIFKMEVFE
jgi:serine protease AprX